MGSYDERAIVDHYEEQAKQFGASPESTMEEQVIREKELAAICNFIEHAWTRHEQPIECGRKILDLGCGNGFALNYLHKKLSQMRNELYGIDFTQSFVDIANSHNIPECKIQQGDARDLPFESNTFDCVYTERCLINIMDWEEQQKALDEVHRVLKNKGYYLMMECFTDGMDNNNKARQEMGLSNIGPAIHNFYFEKEKFFKAIEGKFKAISPEIYGLSSNFLSTHYFVARILHPLLTKGEWVKNTEFVKFFAHMPPYGNYSPLQLYVLEKI